MNTNLLIMRIEQLCEKKGIKPTTAFVQSGVGKNFKSNLPSVSKKNLTLLADYFGVSVEYLIGEESDADYERKIVRLVVNWLKDNDYEYSEEENDTVSVGKDGNYIYLAMSDFKTECMEIKRHSEEDAFKLAMLDWERRSFGNHTKVSVNSHNKAHNVISDSENIISNSPNATLTINEDDNGLSKQEKEIIDMYRDFSLEEQLKLIAYALQIKNGEV